MTLDDFITIATTILSFAALYLTLKKQKHDTAKTDSEVDNIDADTIKTLRGLIDDQERERKVYKAEQEALYNKLAKDFADYKTATSLQIEDIVNENVKLRRWARKLVAQLEAANIIPAPFEL